MFHYINTNHLSIHSTSYSHIILNKRLSNIDLFLIKNLPYKYNYFTMHKLFSNLPIMLEMERQKIHLSQNKFLRRTEKSFTK